MILKMKNSRNYIVTLLFTFKKYDDDDNDDDDDDKNYDISNI